MVFPYSSQVFFNISMAIYLFCFLGYLIFTASRNKIIGTLPTCLLIIGLVIHSAGLLARWLETHHTGYGYVPLSNMYESLIFFSWAIVLIYLILEFKYRQKIIGVFITPFAFLAIALTSIVPGIDAKITPLMPALQSNWLAIHVTTCFFGYASFAVSFGVSILYLIRDGEGSSKEGSSKWLPSTPVLDEINYKSIVIGFPMLSLGIVTGAAWANYAWGSYWSWDPKETWSLITWFVYAAFLHARLQKIGGEERRPFCRLLDLARSYLPILASIISFRGFIAMLSKLPRKLDFALRQR